MFDRIFDFVQNFLHLLLPFVVLQPYEAGVLIRLGEFKRTIGPGGFHWCYPLNIDRVWEDHITPRTHHLAGLATTTKDGKSIGFDAVVTYRISDIEKALLRVTQVQDAISDTCMGIIGTTLSDSSWDDVLHGLATDGLTEACRKRGWKWGIEIIGVQLAGVCLVKNIRLSQGTA